MQNVITTCETIGSTTTCTVDYSDGFFTSGDLFISLELFIIIVLGLTLVLTSSMRRIPVTKKYVGNNSTDGKEIYEI